MTTWSMPTTEHLRKKTLNLYSQMAGGAQGCSYGDRYQKIVEYLYARFRVFKKQAR